MDFCNGRHFGSEVTEKKAKSLELALGNWQDGNSSI
jgi:hypothetical protein